MTDHRRPVDITHTTLSILVLVLLVAATLWVLSPFFTALLWATIISIATWPILLRIQSALGGRRGLAVTAMTLAVLLIVFVPVTLALRTIVRNAQTFTAEIGSLESISLPPPPSWLESVPLQGARMSAAWTRFAALSPEERSAALTPYIQRGLQWFVAQAGSVGAMLLQFLLTTIISAIVLANGESAREGILRFARRLAGQQGYDAAVLAGKTIRSVVLGVVVTALIQTAVGGFGLFISGIPAASLLTAVLLFFCLCQLGPLPVMLPAAVWLFWSGSTGWGAALLAIAVVAGVLDNVLRPLLIKRGADVPLLLIFSGVIGGLIAIGIMGLFIGPVVLTVAYTLLTQWVSAGELPADVDGPAAKAML